MKKTTNTELATPRSKKTFLFGSGRNEKKYRRHLSFHKIYPVVAGNPNSGENGLPKTLIVGETPRLHFSYSSTRAVERAKLNEVAGERYGGMISAHMPAYIASGVKDFLSNVGLEAKDEMLLSIAHMAYKMMTRKDAVIKKDTESSPKQRQKMSISMDVPCLPATWLFRKNIGVEIGQHIAENFESIEASLISFWSKVKISISGGSEKADDANKDESKITYKQPSKLEEGQLRFLEFMRSKIRIDPITSVLFGRMMAGVEEMNTFGAVSSSDDISVGPVRIKSSIATTRDELGKKRGAVDYLSMRGTASALMTSTRTINIDDLLKNLSHNIGADAQELPDLVGETISCYAEVFAQSTPAGKQNTSDTRSTPALLVLEVGSMPTTADSAFYDAIETGVGNVSSQACSRLAYYLSVEKEQWRASHSAPSDIYYLDSTGAFIPDEDSLKKNEKIKFHRVGSLKEMVEIAARIGASEAS